MGREKRNQEDLFNDIVSLSYQVGSLKGIVQNAGVPVEQEELYQWSEMVNDAINNLSSLREDVIRFYQD
ncbi:hypothetical protein P4V41_07715 [Fictibacillus nanhaiensis]|uniref:hypothetical protein n=1 Tax=Fictibacillus nanhaiensis TaxID=742169 RepID=UPI002E20DD7D|nr:hypothetical protein [Fictibacillus nanhaiensis]